MAEAAVAALPSHPQASFQPAVVYWLLDDTDRAEAAYAEATRCNASLIGERRWTEERVQKLQGKENP